MIHLLDYGLAQFYKNMGVYGMSYDTKETDKEIKITMSVPGLRQDDIDIIIRNNKRLIIKCSKSTKFSPGFDYAFSLPCEIIKEETYAIIENGILEVTLIKKEPDEYKITLK